MKRKLWVQIAVLLVVICMRAVFAQTNNTLHGTASLSGVLKGGSGESIALHLEPTSPSPVRSFEGYEAALKDDGQFTFTAIPAGEYRISVQSVRIYPKSKDESFLIDNSYSHPSYDQRSRQWSYQSGTLKTNFGGTVITLHSGEARKGVVVELTHKQSICGHITIAAYASNTHRYAGDDTHSVPDKTYVQLYRRNTEYGSLEYIGGIETDDQGFYQFSDLRPGTYYLQSHSTWYPSVSSFDEAEPIVVTDAPATSCKADYQLIPQRSCTVVMMTGKVDSNPELDKNQYDIVFLTRNKQGVSINGSYYNLVVNNPKLEVNAGAEFRKRICPGEYDVVLSQRYHASSNEWGNTPSPSIIFDKQHVTIRDDKETHVTLTPHAMATIDGELVFSNVKKEDLCVQCQSTYVSILRKGDGEFQTTVLSAERHFSFHNVTPGEYQIFISDMKLDKVYLKSITVDGVEGSGSHFQITSPKYTNLKVTLSGDLALAKGHASPDARKTQSWQAEGARPLASISGKVESDGRSTYKVWLLPIDSKLSEKDPRLTTQSAEDGSFAFATVPPGLYHLRAQSDPKVQYEYGANGPKMYGEPLLVAAGAHLKGLTIATTQKEGVSSVCGQLRDSKGNPKSTRIWLNPAPIGLGSSTGLVTDSSGYFRFDHVVGGEYSFAADSQPQPRILSPNNHEYDHTQLHVTPGKSIGCGTEALVQLRIPEYEDAPQTASVSGSLPGNVMAGLSNDFEAEISLSMDNGLSSRIHKGIVASDRTFAFNHIPAGRYEIRIYGFMATGEKGTRLLVASQKVEVADKDISGVTLTPLKTSSISGVITSHLKGKGWKEFRVSDLLFTLRKENDRQSFRLPLTVNAVGQGVFSVAAIDAGKYYISVSNVSRGVEYSYSLFISSVKLDGKVVKPTEVSIAADTAVNLEIELSNAYASVHAMVNPNPTNALPAIPLKDRCDGEGNNVVILLPDPSSNPAKNTLTEYTTRALDAFCRGYEHGRLREFNGTISGIIPGKYYALSVRDGSLRLHDIGVLDEGKHRQYVESLQTIATPVVLHEGEKLELELTDKTLEASRIAGKVGIPIRTDNITSSVGIHY